MSEPYRELSSKPRVLAVGYGASATGFSRVFDSIIQHLQKDYTFYHFAVNHRCDRVESPWPVFGNNDWRDTHGLERLSELIKRLEPDIVLFLHDLWFCCIHAHRMNKMLNRPMMVAYCPVDGILTRPNLYSGLGLFDQIVAYNQMGKEQLSQIFHEDKPLALHCLTKSIEAIPHGIDFDTFFPWQPDDLLDRSAAKRKLFGSETGFIVLNAAKHQERKRLDLTIEGFARFAHNKPSDVKLYLHTSATFDGPDLRILASKAGITDRLISTDGWLENHPAVDDERLNLIYNATDVGINTSYGEGWGLISFEHAATGAPQIVPAHSACEELWSAVDTILPIHNEREHFGLGMRFKFVDSDDIACMLEKLYCDRKFRQDQAIKAYNNAHQSVYRWDNIAKQWDCLLKRILTERNNTVRLRSRPKLTSDF